jgi:hypothetical protein
LCCCCCMHHIVVFCVSFRAAFSLLTTRHKTTHTHKSHTHQLYFFTHSKNPRTSGEPWREVSRYASLKPRRHNQIKKAEFCTKPGLRSAIFDLSRNKSSVPSGKTKSRMRREMRPPRVLRTPELLFVLKCGGWMGHKKCVETLLLFIFLYISYYTVYFIYI